MSTPTALSMDCGTFESSLPHPMETGLVDERFSVRDALNEGVSKSTMRGMPIPFRGARDLSPAATGRDRYELARNALLKSCLAYASVAPRSYAFSHVTAAGILRIPVPHRLPMQPLHVTVPLDVQPPRRVGVAGHRGPIGSRRVGGVPVIPPELVWLQLASVLTLDELVVAGDYLVRRKKRLSSMQAIRRALAEAAGTRGVELAREAFADVRANTDSPRESMVRLILVRAGLPEPAIRHTIYHEGAFVGTPDLAYVAQQIAIEYEGEDHRLNPDIYEDDIYRREMFERAGWHVYLVTAARLRHPAAVVAHVRELLAAS